MLIRSFGLIFAATTAAAAATIHPNECIHEVYRFLCLGIMIGNASPTGRLPTSSYDGTSYFGCCTTAEFIITN